MRTTSRTILCLVLAALHGVAQAGSPPNDHFANATGLGNVPAVTAEGTLAEATAEPDEPFLDGSWDGPDASIWWSWTCPAASSTRLVTISTAGSTWTYLDGEVSVTRPLDTTLHVFTGDDLTTLTPVAESRDGATDRTSRAAFIATANTTYRIRISVPGHVALSGGNVAKIALTSQAAPVTADDHVAWGKAKLLHIGGWEEYETPFFAAAVLNAAAEHFQAAVVLSRNHPEANVLGALVDLLKLLKEEAFATLLAQLGVQDDSVDPDFPIYYLPEDVDGQPLFADGALTTHGINYFKGPVRARLNAALAALEKVTSTTFLGEFPDHTRIVDETVLIDYGDVVLLRGGCKVLLALIDLLESYDLAASLEDLVDLNRDGSLNAENVTRTFGNLLQFSGSDKRGSLKSNLKGAITLYNQGRTHIRSKRPLIRDDHHLFPLRGMDAEEDSDIKSTLDKIDKSLGGTTITEDGWSFNLSKLFAGTLSLRSMAPNFKGDQVIKGSIVNPTLNGALPGATVQKLENELPLYEGFLDVTVLEVPGDETFGDVEGGGQFLAGALVNPALRAIPELGYVFAGWQLDELFVSGITPYVFPVIRDYTLFAHFDRDMGDDDKDGLSNYHEVQLGTNMNNVDTDGDGWPDGLDQQPTIADERRFSVSQSLADISLTLSSGSIIAITKLPPGVTYDARNQLFVGRPNAIREAEQTFTVVATVKPANGPTFKLDLVLTVEALPAGMAGVFNGLVMADPGLNADMGGSITATISTSGSVTGKIVLGGKSTSFGPVRLETEAGQATASVTVPPIKRKGLPDLDIAFTVSSLTGELVGTANDSNTDAPVDLLARRANWSSSNKATAYTGVYNAALLLDPTEVDDLAYPQGAGFATLKITDTGTATWGGKLADGTAITGGTTLAAEGELALHRMLYNNTGSVQGWAQIVGSDLDGLTPFEWVKSHQGEASKSKNYKEGFAKHELTMQGGRYAPPANPSLFTMLGLSAGASNAVLNFTQGKVDPFSQDLTITAPGVIAMPALAAANPNKVKITVPAATGVITGSFTLPGLPARKATISGAVIPGLSKGVGSFLIPDTTTSIFSGAVELLANP